jgi:hypothetical protein
VYVRTASEKFSPNMTEEQLHDMPAEVREALPICGSIATRRMLTTQLQPVMEKLHLEECSDKVGPSRESTSYTSPCHRKGHETTPL